MQLEVRQRWLLLSVLGILLATASVAALRLQGLRQLLSAPLVPVEAAAAPEPQPRLRVHVTGAVPRPGVYELSEGARVADALAAAGGAGEAARPQTLNLAAYLSDGDKIFIPTAADLEAARLGNAPPEAWAATRSAPPLAAGGLRINLNRADRADLMRLPGITSAMATRILKHRERHGRFDRVDELQQVPGIDPETYTKLQPHIYVA